MFESLPEKCLLCNYCKQLLQWVEAAVKRCFAHSTFANTGLWLQRKRCRDGQASICDDLQEERLGKCEREGLEQSRGDWGSPHCGHLIKWWLSASHFVLPLCPCVTWHLGGVFGGPNTELVSSFVGPSSQGVAGGDKISTSCCRHKCRCCL